MLSSAGSPSTSPKHSLEEAFAAVGLRAADHVDQDKSLFRPGDLRSSIGSPAKAREQLGWSATYKMRDVVRAMVAAAESGRPDAPPAHRPAAPQEPGEMQKPE